MPANWTARWTESGGTFKAGTVSFLQPAYINETCRALEMGDDVEEELRTAAQAIAGDPSMERLAWHCHWLLFSAVESAVKDWPEIPVDVHPAGPLFYAVVLLSGVPFVKRFHSDRGVAEDITIDTLSDFELWIREYKRRHGVWGLGELGWLVSHFQGRLYTLGRLQYLPDRFAQPFLFFRSTVTSQVMALAADGVEFRGDGQFSDADGGGLREGIWRSSFGGHAGMWRGSPVSPLGHVRRKEQSLKVDDWVQILGPGDPVLTVHIPATGRMDPVACGASFRQAFAFFAEHFPDEPYNAFTCESWLLDPQLERLDPVPERVVSFLREWYLHPLKGATSEQTMERVFDRFKGQPVVLPALPQHTSLQRAMVAALKGGRHFRKGGGVIFPEDLDWGKQGYRRGSRETGKPERE